MKSGKLLLGAYGVKQFLVAEKFTRTRNCGIFGVLAYRYGNIKDFFENFVESGHSGRTARGEKSHAVYARSKLRRAKIGYAFNRLGNTRIIRQKAIRHSHYAQHGAQDDNKLLHNQTSLFYPVKDLMQTYKRKQTTETNYIHILRIFASH